MADLTLFSYRHRDRGMQLLDARVKLAAMAAVSIATMQSGLYGLALASLLAAFILWKSGIAPIHLIVELRYLAAFLLCIWGIRTLTTPGDSYAQFAFLSISRQGVVSGALLSWRLLLIAIYGLVLTASTPPTRIRSAIEWFLRPIPGIPHQTVGTMIGLLVQFIPIILSQSSEIMNAQRARGVENRKNPVYRLICFGMPLLRHTVVTADRLASAMEARNYNPHRTVRPWRVFSRDYAALFCVVSTCFVMTIL